MDDIMDNEAIAAFTKAMAWAARDKAMSRDHQQWETTVFQQRSIAVNSPSFIIVKYRVSQPRRECVFN